MKRWVNLRSAAMLGTLAAGLSLTAAASAATSSAAPAFGLTGWSMYQASPGHNAILNGPAQGFSWSFNSQGHIAGALSLVNGTLYMDSFDGRLYALDAKTGKLKWDYQTNNKLMNAPIVSQGVVVVGSGSNDVLTAKPTQTVWSDPGRDGVYGISAATGKLLWAHMTVGEDMPTPALVGNLLTFGNGNNVIQALDIGTGKVVWRTPVQGVTTMSSTAAWRGRIYLVAGESPHSSIIPPVQTYALDAATGKILWKAPYGDADDSPVIGQGRIYVEGSTTLKGVPAPNAVNTVDALNARTGQLVWSYTSQHGNSITMGEEASAGTYVQGVLYQSLPQEHELVAFDAATGKILWKVPTHGPVKMSPLVWHGQVLFGDGAGYFYVVDAASGKLLALKRFPKPLYASPPLIAGGTLYVASGETVFALPVKNF